jgi:probable phosphoglycerate mutase
MRSIDLGNPFLPSLDGLCELLLVRHGEQSFTPNMAVADGIDAPLSDLGEKQAAAVGERLATTDLAAIYASPLSRAHNTALAIASHHDLEVQLREDLQELNMFAQLPPELGLLDSIGRDEVLAIYREANRTNRWDAYTYAEPLEPFRTRVVQTIDDIMANHHGHRVVVACHGGVINTYLSHVFGADHDRVCNIHHTSLTTVRAMQDRRMVMAVNDYAHVLPLQTELNPFNVT